MKPKIWIAIEGGVITSIVTNTEVDVTICDYDEDCDHNTVIDGDSPAYIYQGDLVEIDPERTADLFQQAGREAQWPAQPS